MLYFVYVVHSIISILYLEKHILSTQCKPSFAVMAEAHRKWSAGTKDGYVWTLVRFQSGDTRKKRSKLPNERCGISIIAHKGRICVGSAIDAPVGNNPS